MIVSATGTPNAATVTIGCLEVQSGTLDGTSNNTTLTITGDYFRALTGGSLNFTNNTFKIDMAGTAAQTFEVVDDVRDLAISNSTSVTLTDSFSILSDLTITGSGITYIEGEVTLNDDKTQQVIPSGHTVVIKNGGKLFARGGLTENGVLQINGGGELMLRTTENLTISSGGVLTLSGSSGNPARIVSDSSTKFFSFDMAGTMTANYFYISNTDTGGVNVTGTISQLDNGEFRYIKNTGYALVLGAAATVPATADSVGFFNDGGAPNPGNVDASAYNNGTITFDNWSGDVGSATYENDTNAQIDWGTEAVTELSITDTAGTNEPPSSVTPSTASTYGEFAFTLTRADTATDITELIVTMTGTASTSDLAWVRAYRDTGGCEYNGADTQIGSDLSFSGSPPTA